jgi:cytochrome c oxidase subunit 2
MFDMLFPPAGSTYAGDIDTVIEIIAVLVGFWFFLTLGMFFWLLWRFRARPGVKSRYVTGDEKDLGRWVSWPHIAILVCDIVIVVFAVRIWIDVKQTLPEGESPDQQSTVRVTAQQWAWTFVHPGPDNILDTDDDIATVDELHIEVGRLYHYELHSKDVLHDFSVPVFRLKQDAIPGRVIRGWFQPTIEGEYDIQCAEMCGIGHGIMGARIHIESPEQHAAWVSDNSSGSSLARRTDPERAPADTEGETSEGSDTEQTASLERAADPGDNEAL